MSKAKAAAQTKATAEQEFNELLGMTAESLGRDLLGALVQEIKLLPDVWPKLSQKKQDDVIDRLRSRVQHNVTMAVHLIASEGRTVVQGDLDQISIKDGVKAVVKFGSGAPNLHEQWLAQSTPAQIASAMREVLRRSAAGDVVEVQAC